MVVTPNSRCILLKSPLKLDNFNQITFSNAGDQFNYFYNLPKIEHWNYTYVRKDGVIRAETNDDLTFEDLLEYNYCMYQNTHYDNKWFYAFVTDVTYSNDGMTEIKIETDPFQSWQFDLIYKNSFIEREHVSNDTVGIHTVPEGLETGEFTCNAHYVDENFDNVISDVSYVMSASIDYWNVNSKEKYEPAKPTMYNGIVGGTMYYSFDNATAINNTLNDLSDRGQIDTINGLFMAPNSLLTKGQTYNGVNSIASSNSPVTYTSTVSKQTTLNGYSPKNKKLLTGEYNYLLVSNNNGNSNVLRYEDFSGSNCSFKVDMCLTPGCSIRMIPTNFKNLTNADEYGLNLGKLPICSYPTDMYTNWLTQNSVNVMGIKISSDDINVATSTIGAISGLAGSPYTLTGSAQGLAGITNSLIAKKQHELIPPESRGNLNAGDVVTASGKNTFHFYKMSIRNEYAKIIDDYFTMYGYKINEVKALNIHKRSNWDFIKTIQVNIEGDVPEKDLDSIRSLFDNGCTFWHTTTNFLDYSKTNSIL